MIFMGKTWEKRWFPVPIFPQANPLIPVCEFIHTMTWLREKSGGWDSPRITKKKRPGKHPKNDGKSPFSMGKLTKLSISTGPFSIAM
jgi:hypothetical protein